MGGRGSGSNMASSSSSSRVPSVTVGGNTYSLQPQDIREQSAAYMQWLDKGTARMHALGIVDNHDNYSDEYLMHGGSLAHFLTRNTVQNVINKQGNKSRVELSDLHLSQSQQSALTNAIRQGVKDWYDRDSSTKAGAAAYRKLRRTYNPTTRMYG